MILKLYTKKLGEQIVLLDDIDAQALDPYSWTLWTSKRHHGIYVIGYLKINSKKSIRFCNENNIEVPSNLRDIK